MPRQQEKRHLNLDNLQKQLDKGNNIFSYKQLCEILEYPFKKGGKARQNQFIYWKKFIDMYLVGYKWHVNKIYDFDQTKFIPYYNVFPTFLQNKDCSGIYKIYNDDYIYFGSSVNIKNRFCTHYSDKSLQNTYNILHTNGIFDVVEKCIIIDRDNSKKFIAMTDSPFVIPIDKRLQNINNNSYFNDSNIRICSCSTMRDLELYYIHKYYFDQLEHNFQPPFHRKLINSIGITICNNINKKNPPVNKKITTSIPLNFLIENPTIKQAYLDFINTLKSNINSLNMTDEQIDDFFKNYTKNINLLFDNFDYNIFSKEVLVYE